MRIHKVRKKLEYFLVLRTLASGCRRWIEYVDWEVGRDDTGIYITTPISLPTPVFGGNIIDKVLYPYPLSFLLFILSATDSIVSNNSK